MKNVFAIIIIIVFTGLAAQPIPFKKLKEKYYDTKGMDSEELKHYEEYKEKYRKLGLREKPDYTSDLTPEEYKKMGKHAEKTAENRNYIDYFYSLGINLDAYDEFKKLGIRLDSLTMDNPFAYLEKFNEVILFSPVIVKARVTKEIDTGNYNQELRIEKIYKGEKYYNISDNVILRYDKLHPDWFKRAEQKRIQGEQIFIPIIPHDELIPKVGYSYIFFLDVNLDGLRGIEYKHPYIYNVFNNPMECDYGLTYGYKVPDNKTKDNEKEFEKLVNKIENLNEYEAKHPDRKLILERDSK
jgi:hypothetical protein